MPARPPRPKPGDVRVWYAHTHTLGPSSERPEQIRAWLNAAEHARFARFRRDVDRNMFLLGRIMARHLVGEALGVAPTAWPWRDGARGRPDVDLPDCPVSFNLAHSGGLVACAVAVGTTVGVDVEDRRRPALDRQLVTRYCATSEQVAIDAAGPDGWQDRFLCHWTLKEAYLKARGLGLAVHLADLAFSIEDDRVTVTFAGELAGADTRWAFALVAPEHDHYIAAAAQASPDRPPRFAFQPLPPAVLAPTA